jgi:hypothetical protein
MALVGGEWSASRPCRFIPGETAPGTHWIGGWVGPRAGLDYVEKRKFLTLLGLELRPSVVQPVASRYTDWAIPTHDALRETFKIKFASTHFWELHSEYGCACICHVVTAIISGLSTDVCLFLKWCAPYPWFGFLTVHWFDIQRNRFST